MILNPATDTVAKNSFYSWYAATVLTLAYALSVIDRQILLLMIGPIERELHLTDIDFALLSGGAFGIFYAVFGIPLGWAADRFSRKWIITFAILCWSSMTIASGLSNSFTQLLIARIGVAIGEAALSPAAHSLLADFFPATKLPKALSLYSSALFIGTAVALIVGGGILTALTAGTLILPLALSPWRIIFLLCGILGLFLALWIMALREPARYGARSNGPNSPQPSFSLLHYLTENKTQGTALIIGPALIATVSFMDFWYPELFIRTWGWTIAESGQANGLSSLIFGPLGIICAGFWSSRLLRNGHHDSCLRLAACAALALGIASFLMPLMPTATSMLCLLGLSKFIMGFTPVLIPSAIQLTVPHHLRAQYSALFLFGTGAIGMSMGPLSPPLINSLIFADPMMMRYSLSIAAILISIPAWLCVRAGYKGKIA